MSLLHLTIELTRGCKPSGSASCYGDVNRLMASFSVIFWPEISWSWCLLSHLRREQCRIDGSLVEYFNKLWQSVQCILNSLSQRTPNAKCNLPYRQ